MVQWVGLHTFMAEGPGSIPGRGTKIPQATCGMAKKKKGGGGITGENYKQLYTNKLSNLD